MHNSRTIVHDYSTTTKNKPKRHIMSERRNFISAGDMESTSLAGFLFGNVNEDGDLENKDIFDVCCYWRKTGSCSEMNLVTTLNSSYHPVSV